MHAPARGPAVEASTSASELRAAISERVGESRFGLWFGDGVDLGLSGDGNALEVRVPDAFFRDWIKRHYTSSLLEAAEAVAGRPLELSIRVRDEGEPPMGDVVPPAPTRNEPDPQPHRRQTVKIPGNPKAPLAFPTPDTSSPDPGPISIPPRSDQPHPRNRMHARPEAAGATASPAASPSPGRPPRRLEGFMTGPGNRLAHAAARDGPSRPAPASIPW